MYRKIEESWKSINIKAKVISIGISGRLHTVDGAGRIYWPDCDVGKQEKPKDFTIIKAAIGVIICVVSCIFVATLIVYFYRKKSSDPIESIFVEPK